MPRVVEPPRTSAAAAAALVNTGDWVDYGLNGAQPIVFDRALAARVNELREVKIRSGLALAPRAVLRNLYLSNGPGSTASLPASVTWKPLQTTNRASLLAWSSNVPCNRRRATSD